MRRAVLSFTIFIAASSSAWAEEVVASRPAAQRSRLGLTASYLGETGTHPGLVLGVDLSLLHLGMAHELFVRGLLGGYVHSRLYWALFAGGEIGWRSTASFGLRGEVALGVAYLHTVLASPVYAVGSDGQVTATSDLGRPGVMPSASLGVGWDFGRRTRFPLTVMLRPIVFWQVPVNQTALVHFGGLLSFTYSLES